MCKLDNVQHRATPFSDRDKRAETVDYILRLQRVARCNTEVERLAVVFVPLRNVPAAENVFDNLLDCPFRAAFRINLV